jgi:proline iminopeptidase
MNKLYNIVFYTKEEIIIKEILIPLKDGKNIYTRYYNNNNKQTLLYLHGGPGASCSSFQYCAYKLSKYMNVVLIDERGVLRSDKIEKGEKCDIDMLVEDCESVRSFLKINKFIVVGQSFGGFIALLYAIKYPNSVEKVIFENPSFDFTDSIKSIQSKAIEILENKEQNRLANYLKNNINSIDDIRDFIDKWSEVSEEIRNEVYHLKKYDEYTEEQKNLLKVDIDYDERWQYSAIHFNKIINDENTYKNIIGLIKKLKRKSLLICGEFDPVFSVGHIKYYEDNIVNGKVAIVKNCGHFIHTDSADEYIEIVRDFVE